LIRERVFSDGTGQPLPEPMQALLQEEYERIIQKDSYWAESPELQTLLAAVGGRVRRAHHEFKSLFANEHRQFARSAKSICGLRQSTRDAT
jgi:hypothetical protein